MLSIAKSKSDRAPKRRFKSTDSRENSGEGADFIIWLGATGCGAHIHGIGLRARVARAPAVFPVVDHWASMWASMPADKI